MSSNVTHLNSEQLLEILALSKDATCIFTTKELKVGFANNALLSFWDKAAEVIGMELYDAMPELRGTRFPAELKEVWLTGNTFQAKDVRAELFLGGKPIIRYFDYIFKALANEDGRTYAILHTATEVTDRVLSMQLIKEKDETEKKLAKQLFIANEGYRLANEELNSVNKEYSITNEELRLSNGELSRLRKELEKANILLSYSNISLREQNSKLTASEQKALEIFSGAPIAVAVLSGKEMVIESANAMILEIWGKPPTIMGETLISAIPELKGQKFPDLLAEVFLSGKAFYGSNEKVLLERNGTMTEGYYNFVYHPLKNKEFLTERIMVVAIEVTEQVKANQLVQTLNESLAFINEELRATNIQVNSANQHAKFANNQLTLANDQLNISQKQVVEAEQMLRQAIEATNFGTWNLNTQTGKFVTSQSLKKLFGFLETEEPTLADCISQITQEYQDIVNKRVAQAISLGGDYDLSYSIIGRSDGKLRWVRAVGHLTVDKEGIIETFAGVVIDITAQKHEDQLKNDFISMVSHELKTPLTSLMGYVQMLQILLKNTADLRVLDMLKRSLGQVTRMNSMITGFLDVSRFDGGKIYIETSTFSLTDLIKEIIDDIVVTATTHTIIFKPIDDFLVIADREKIGQVIQNLLSNALKYSAQGENIEIFCTPESEVVTVSFRDYGVGIKAEDLTKLFDRFYRIENSQTKTIAGFGIGLYICWEIIKRHNGKIWAESNGKSGSTFKFSLPMQ